MINIEYVNPALYTLYSGFRSCEVVFDIQPDEFFLILKGLHLPKLVGDLADLFNFNIDVEGCPKDVL